MRGLSPSFLHDLQFGCLQPILDRTLQDRTLCLELRDEYINVYYRGGNLLRVQKVPNGYIAAFDVNYAKPDKPELPSRTINTTDEAAAWVDKLPYLKMLMDLWLGKHTKEEREAQQLMVRDNNTSRLSRKTDFCICDIEYANPNGRFDLVGVHWPAKSQDRKTPTDRRLMFGEVKFGDDALSGKAGLHAHVHDVERFLSSPDNLVQIKAEMRNVFNQKRQLGLMNCGKDLDSFSDEKPLFLLLLVNHNPNSTILQRELHNLPETRHVDLRIVVSSMMGYGIFDPGVLTLEALRARHGGALTHIAHDHS